MENPIDSNQVFVNLNQLLVKTADDAANYLKVLKGNLSEFDSRHKLFLMNSSKFQLKGDIRAAKNTTSGLRGVASQIVKCEKPTELEVTAARSAMHTTVNALNDLARSARTFDKKDHKLTGVAVDLLYSVKGSTNEPNERKGDDLESLEIKRTGSEGVLRAPDTAEEVVALTLGDCFSGFKELQHQIATAEKSLSPLFAGQPKSS